MALTPDYTIGNDGLPNILKHRRTITNVVVAAAAAATATSGNTSKNHQQQINNNNNYYNNNKLLNKRGNSIDVNWVINASSKAAAATIDRRKECRRPIIIIDNQHRFDKTAKDMYNQRLKLNMMAASEMATPPPPHRR